MPDVLLTGNAKFGDHLLRPDQRVVVVGPSRRVLRDWLLKRRREDTGVDTAALLVTDAVLHTAGPSVCLTVDEAGPVMHVAVHDSSREFSLRPGKAPAGFRTG